ncbi:MAG: hypothetical protein GEV04_23245, partial [Actinophytocola sp.]|nr:hypothetical protein [Actinophytocola sp.]
MPIAIDSSRPYLSPSELEDLVRAVMGADPHNESTWIEWKSRLGLEEMSTHHHIAKHVLGFANRTVETARAHAGGYAYLIIGADPKGLLGISPVDPANLRPWIERYVGSAVRWRSEYLTEQNKQVLVVIVEPPRAGDPIYPLRRHFQTTYPKSTHHPLHLACLRL